MQNSKLVLKTLLFLLITTYFALALQSNSLSSRRSNQPQNVQEINRDKRLIFKKKGKPGFVRTLFSVIYEQWLDSKNTIHSVKKLVNDNFAPEDGQALRTTPPPLSSDPNATTTAAPAKLKRSELARIIRRNVKGLVRLFNIELQDALKISNDNYAAYKRNASKEVSKHF